MPYLCGFRHFETPERKYYLNPDNSICSGWKKLGGKWYYFLDSNCKLAAQGRWGGMMGTGILQIKNTWYILSPDMKTGWKKISGKWYYLNKKGVMVTGRQKINGKVYVFGSNGVWIR